MRRRPAWLSVGRRSHFLPLLLVVLLMAVCGQLWRLADVAGIALRPSTTTHDLGYLRRSRSLKQYLDDIQLLIEPSSTRCEGAEDLPFLVLVSSAPDHLERRAAIRTTWARHQPTVFFLGVDGMDKDEMLVDSYIEAKEFGDMVVFDFQEHYDNLTLKTGLMLHWSRRRCPTAGAVMKTDDDVLVNPWMMKEVLKTHRNHQLIGYKMNSSRVHREEHSKWHLPRWLYPQDDIPEYLSGTGYIIQGEYIEKMLKASYKTPLINLEDVYYTLNVAKRTLGLSLSHDRRLSPYKPWLATGCAVWGLATIHSLAPTEMVAAFKKLENLAKEFERGGNVCSLLWFLSGDWFLY